MDDAGEELLQYTIQHPHRNQYLEREESEAGVDVFNGRESRTRSSAAHCERHDVYRDALAEHSVRTRPEAARRHDEVELLTRAIIEFAGCCLLRRGEPGRRVLQR